MWGLNRTLIQVARRSAVIRLLLGGVGGCDSAVERGARHAQIRGLEMSVSCDQEPRPDRSWTNPMDDALEARSQSLCHHFQRPLAGRRNLLNENAGNTLNETDPPYGFASRPRSRELEGLRDRVGQAIWFEHEEMLSNDDYG